MLCLQAPAELLQINHVVPHQLFLPLRSKAKRCRPAAACLLCMLRSLRPLVSRTPAASLAEPVSPL